MKKSTKAAIATGAAAALLMGGAGTLAYWTDQQTAAGGTLTAGNLTLSAVSCPAAWTEGAGTVAVIVPGDTVTKACTATLTLAGDHIAAGVEVDDASADAAEAAFNLPATAGDAVDITAAVTNPASGTVTGAGAHPVTITITVDWPFGTISTDPQTNADNDAKGVSTSALNNLKLNAVQVDPHP